jgi:hypothetical protein
LFSKTFVVVVEYFVFFLLFEHPKPTTDDAVAFERATMLVTQNKQLRLASA